MSTPFLKTYKVSIKPDLSNPFDQIINLSHAMGIEHLSSPQSGNTNPRCKIYFSNGAHLFIIDKTAKDMAEDVAEAMEYLHSMPRRSAFINNGVTPKTLDLD